MATKQLDLRIRKTYKALCDAFTCLLEQRRYEEITISDLCDEALIRRTTFYKHFADKQEFFVFYIWTIRDEFDERIDVDPAQDASTYIAQMSGHMVAFFLEHEQLLDSALASNMIGLLCDAFVEMIKRDLLAMAFAENAGQEAEFQAAYMAGGIMQATRTWWQRRENDPEGQAVVAVLAAMASRLLAAR